jgi:acetylornithine deacetylase/succinyl-diaminopimelate desuccinylase-like protein
VSVPHESPKDLAESLAADAEKMVSRAACHARGEEPANHIRELAQAVRHLAKAVKILAQKMEDLDRQ